MNNFGAPWTEQELDKLKTMTGKYTYTQISEEIGRSKEGIRKQLQKLKKISWTPDVVPAPEEKKAEVPIAVKKPATKKVAYVGTVEYCPNCKSPVSSWDEHLQRMSRFGCVRVAA